jgi:outer membrane protein assembly factor BamD
MPRRVFRASVALVVLAAACGCGAPPAQSALGYSENAKHAYEEALEQFNAHNWIEAQTLLREVKRKYSYSKYARMAELRIADADLEQDKQPDAIREYKDFIRAHPADEDNVAYARSRIAEASFSEIPESFLAPAPEEREQGSVVDAYKELKSYLSDYPSSKQSAHIRDLLERVTQLLVRHELYVARFYLGKGNYDAAVARVEYALRTYGSSEPVADTIPPGAPGGAMDAGSATGASASPALMADALLLLGETYLQMHKWRDARQAFQAVIQSERQGPSTIEAQHYLEFLRKKGV